MKTHLIALALTTAAFGTACSGYYGPHAAPHAKPHYSPKSNVGFGGGIGTTGGYLEAKYTATDAIVLRGSVNYLPLSGDKSYDGVDYEAETDMVTGGGFADIHPFHNGFHLSGGAYIGDKSGDLLGTPGAATVVEIGDETYTGAEIGTLRGRVKYNSFAPFLGMGYDGFVNPKRTWSFNARAGVMFAGSPSVDLQAEGGLSSNFPSVQTELEREALNLEEELEDYKYYPVVTLGVTRRF